MKYKGGTYFKVLVESGTARPTALVFSFLLDEEAALPLSFLFFSEFALACSRRKLTGDTLVSDSSCGSMSESMIGRRVLEVATIDSSVADDNFTCVLERDAMPAPPRGMMSLTLMRARYPTVPAEKVGATLKGHRGCLHGCLFMLATGSVEDINKQ